MNYAIILSGGIGTRMNSNGLPKQYMEVNKKPIIVYTLEKFESAECVDKIIIVADKIWHGCIKTWISDYKITKFKSFCLPGKSRQGSILSGLEKCVESSSPDDGVIIHDAVRPLVSDKLISKCIAQLNLHEGCMPVIPVSDTIYFSKQGVKIDSLLERDKLFAGQAPEAFNLLKYYQINKELSADELDKIKGTTEIAYLKGLDIVMTDGEFLNFKITTPEDLKRFEAIVGKENQEK